MMAGELKHRIIFQKPDDFASRIGGSKSYHTFATVWAKIVPMSGRENMNSTTKKDEAMITHVITIRFLRGLTPDMRISFESRTLKIRAIRNLNERNREIEIDAYEEADGESGY